MPKNNSRDYKFYQNNFSGGLSADPMFGSGNQYNIMNLAHDRSAGYLYLANIYKDTTDWRAINGTLGDVINNLIVKIEDNGSNKDLKYYDMDTGTLQLTVTIGSGPNPRTFITHKGVYFIAYGGKVLRENPDSATFEFKEIDSSNEKTVFYEYGDDMYFGYENNVYVMDRYQASSGDTDLYPDLVITEGETIIGIYRMGMYFYIVSDKSVYIWQGIEEAVDYAIPITGKVKGSALYSETVFILVETTEYYVLNAISGNELVQIFKENKNGEQSRINLLEFEDNILFADDYGLFFPGQSRIYRFHTSKNTGGLELQTFYSPILKGDSLFGFRNGYLWGTDNFGNQERIVELKYDEFATHGFVEFIPDYDGAVTNIKRASKLMTGVYMPENTIAYLSLKYDNNEDNVFNFFVSSGAVSDFTKGVSFTDGNTYPFEVTGQLQFTIGGNVFTIIQSKYTGTDMNEEIYLKIMKAQSGMLTNTDSDIIKYNNISDYEIIDTVDREGIIKDITMLQGRKYHTIQLRVDFVTNQTNTIYPKRPYLYDIFYGYEVIENQF